MFAGDVEVDEVLTKNDVGNSVTIISHLVDKPKIDNLTSKSLSFLSFFFKTRFQIISLINDIHKNMCHAILEDETTWVC